MPSSVGAACLGSCRRCHCCRCWLIESKQCPGHVLLGVVGHAALNCKLRAYFWACRRLSQPFNIALTRLSVVPAVLLRSLPPPAESFDAPCKCSTVKTINITTCRHIIRQCQLGAPLHAYRLPLTMPDTDTPPLHTHTHTHRGSQSATFNWS